MLKHDQPILGVVRNNIISQKFKFLEKHFSTKISQCTSKLWKDIHSYTHLISIIPLLDHLLNCACQKSYWSFFNILDTISSSLHNCWLNLIIGSVPHGRNSPIMYIALTAVSTGECLLVG